MKLITIGSGSTGNAYALVGEKSTLLIECGLPYKEAILPAIDFARDNVCGCIISHSHKDHAGSIKYLLNDCVTCLMPPTMFDDYKTSEYATEAKKDTPCRIGEFTIFPMEMVHDVECYGYVIYHPEMGQTLFITDTGYVPQDLSEVRFSHIMIETNYGEDIVKGIMEADESKIPHIKHIMRGHLSVESAMSYLTKLNLSVCESISLIHMSNSHSNEKEFVIRVKNAFPKVNVYPSTPNTTINFNKKPY